MSKKPIKEWTDSEVLAFVGDMGPAFVGEELHARAQRIRRDNPGGVLGPAFVDTKVEKPKAAKSERRAKDQDAAVEEAFVEGTLPEEDRRADEPPPSPVPVEAAGEPILVESPKAPKRKGKKKKG